MAGNFILKKYLTKIRAEYKKSKKYLTKSE